MTLLLSLYNVQATHSIWKEMNFLKSYFFLIDFHVDMSFYYRFSMPEGA